jgi:hypothetical protein
MNNKEQYLTQTQQHKGLEISLLSATLQNKVASHTFLHVLVTEHNM